MKVILYQGTDQDFYDDLRASADKVQKCEVILQTPGKGKLSAMMFRFRPHIVIVDAQNSHYLAEEIQSLRMISDFQQTLFAAFCKDESEVKLGESLIVSGIQLFHVKDTDFETFFRDCCQIAFESDYHQPDFARARDLDIPLRLGFLSALTSVTDETLTLETDFTAENELHVTLPVFPESELTLNVQRDIGPGATNRFQRCSLIRFPFPGPWDEVTENSLSPETVATWIEFRKDSFDKRKGCIALILDDPEILTELINEPGPCWYQFFKETSEAIPRLACSRPGLVFIDLSTRDVRNLGEVVGTMKEYNPRALIIAFNSESGSEALRKLFDYEFILSIPGGIDLPVIRAMEKKFSAKAAKEDPNFYLRPDDPDRMVEVMRKVKLTSITERDMTFILDEDVPYFTVLRTRLPLPSFLTIIPAEGRLPATTKGRHYRALIHGLSEENLAKLRKVVNQLIYCKVDSLTAESVETMLKQDYVVPGTTAAPAAEKKIADATEAQEPMERFTLKRNTRGISKL